MDSKNLKKPRHSKKLSDKKESRKSGGNVREEQIKHGNPNVEDMERRRSKEDKNIEPHPHHQPTQGLDNQADKVVREGDPTEAFMAASSKIINVRKADVLPKVPPIQNLPIHPETPPDIGLPFEILDEATMKKIEDTIEDVEIGEQLSEIMDHYRGEKTTQARKAKKSRYPKYTYTEIVSMLTKQGIPVPSDDDFARLEASHGTRWDPDGTVVEYYSPVLRSFIPINMRGRYRGCWTEDHCIQGLDISKLEPKPDALEGYVDRGRQFQIEKKYEEMSKVAVDEAHLDYLIEMQKFQSEILPIPLFYDVLNFGGEILGETLRIVIDEEGLPPTNRIYKTTEDQALLVRKKISVYMALGLEPLDSQRPGMGRINPEWEKTRDELITSIIARRNQDEYMKQMQEDADMFLDEIDKTEDKAEESLDVDKGKRE